MPKRKNHQFYKRFFGQYAKRTPQNAVSFVLLLLNKLLDLSGLADSLAEIVQLSAANLTASYKLYLLNYRRVYRENSLDAAAVSYTSYGKGLVDTAVLLGNNSTLEDLDPRLVTLSDSYVYLYGITNVNYGCVFLHA